MLPGSASLLQARCHVDAVSVDIVRIDYDVAAIEARRNSIR